MSYVQALTGRMETAYRVVEQRRYSYDLRVRPADFKIGDCLYYFTPRRRQGRRP